MAAQRRRVYVRNACFPERVCPDGSCSVGSICAAVDVAAAAVEEEEEVAVEPTPPTITLIGPTAVSVPQGEPYTRCTADALPSTVRWRGRRRRRT